MGTVMRLLPCAAPVGGALVASPVQQWAVVGSKIIHCCTAQLLSKTVCGFFSPTRHICGPGPLLWLLCVCLHLQVGFLPHFLDALRAAAGDPSSPLHQQIDFHNLGAAGHSRGAKIAALHFAGVCVLGTF